MFVLDLFLPKAFNVFIAVNIIVFKYQNPNHYRLY